jgi:hypothetical protein
LHAVEAGARAIKARIVQRTQFRLQQALKRRARGCVDGFLCVSRGHGVGARRFDDGLGLRRRRLRA